MPILTLPGLIDPHVHLRDPGQTEKEDFYTATLAALHGGYTTLIDMPNNSTPITSHERLEEKRTIAKEKILCDVGFHFGSLGDNLQEFQKVSTHTLGLKLFLNHTTGDYLIDESTFRAIYDAWPGNTPILVHAEEEMLETVLEQVKRTKKPTHVCHISSQFELERVITSKEQGLPVTCGVTPHHLFLSEKDGETLGAFAKVKPPLKKSSDIDFLWSHLSAIDVIESDHAPHTKKEKQTPPTPYGVPGLETTLPLLLTAVHEDKLSLQEVIRLCHNNPARIFGIQQDSTTRIEIDTDAEYEIKDEDLFTKCHWSPFTGMKVRGIIRKVFIRDTLVFSDNSVLVSPGFGKTLPDS